eukprot:283703-Pleurochrysis_carterae.AAC.2
MKEDPENQKVVLLLGQTQLSPKREQPKQRIPLPKEEGHFGQKACEKMGKDQVLGCGGRARQRAIWSLRAGAPGRSPQA